MEWIWFVYPDFLQRKLVEVNNEWNPHTIRYTKECQVSGIPNLLYYLPELKDMHLRVISSVKPILLMYFNK